MKLPASLLVLFMLLAARPALADVVDPEPDSCPPGSTPSTAHTGPYCRPTPDCASDSACGAGATCDAVMQCIETRGCGGLMGPDSAPCTIEHVVGPCAGDGTCAVGECRARQVCNGAASDGGCGCRVAGSSPSRGTEWLCAALAVLLWRRRRSAAG
jgi:MYXO-CTERM domain-containing protein